MSNMEAFIRRWLTIQMHKLDLHYAPVHGPIVGHEDGRPRWQRWCQWCGLRESYRYDPRRIFTLRELVALDQEYKI